MRTLILAASLAPSTLLAHGAHAPVPETVHGVAHSGLHAGLAIVAAAALVALVRRFRS